VQDIDAAALTIVQSAFMTSGQRCTCARRLILMNDAEGDQILERTIHLAKKLRVGPPAMEPEPYMGPVISEQAATAIREAYAALLSRGARELLPLRVLGPAAMLSPAILDVTGTAGRTDEELFAPLLQVVRVPSIEAALAEANHTAFGLSAALLSRDAELYQRFLDAVRAGIINWNRPTNGASSALPFGGTGASGNHRPAGSFSIDYCNDPVASLESPTLSMPAMIPPGITL
jgi:succinylglutamic semialdehyde dehydrogenase